MASPGARRGTEKSSKKLSKYDIDRIGHRGVGDGANEYSLEEERELGRKLSKEVEMTTKLVADPVIAEYVDRLGQTIVRHSDAQVPFTIKVIPTKLEPSLCLADISTYTQRNDHGGR